MNTISEKKIRDTIYSQNKRLFFFKNNGYKEAYERLAIKRQKQYMLNYLKGVIARDMDNTNAEMIHLYKESYKHVCSFDTIRNRERFLFFLFKYLLSVYWG